MKLPFADAKNSVSRILGRALASKANTAKTVGLCHSRTQQIDLEKENLVTRVEAMIQ
jgi:hypothetical protein